MVERAMAQVEGGFATLGRVAVAIGPGSFTGIRIGLAMARAIGLALGVPVVGVSTLVAFAGPLLERAAAGRHRLGDRRQARQVYFQLFEPTGRPMFAPRVARRARRGKRDRRRARRGWPATPPRLIAEEAQRAGLEFDALPRRPLSRHRRDRAHRPRRRSRGVARAPALRQAAGRASQPRRRNRRARGLTGVRWYFGLRRLTPLVIRPLRGDRAEECAAIHAGAFAHPWPAGEFAALLPSASTIGSAALDPATDRLRGFALSRLAADEAEILTIAVDPAWRGRGVGRDLLREHLAARGARRRAGDVSRGGRGQRRRARALRPLRLRSRSASARAITAARTASRRPRW